MHKTNGQQYAEYVASLKANSPVSASPYTVYRLHGQHWLKTTYTSRYEALRKLRG